MLIAVLKTLNTFSTTQRTYGWMNKETASKIIKVVSRPYFDSSVNFLN